jgi:NhaA family Na+:H+ antiporter
MIKQSTTSIDFARDYISGDAAAKVGLILYTDYVSQHARKARRVDLALSEHINQDIAFACRQNPSSDQIGSSEKAARVALAAGLQGKFWEAHERLFAVDPSMSDDAINSLAKELNLDSERLRVDMTSDAVMQRLKEDRESARDASVTASPALFINGQRYDGAWDELSIAEEIERPIGVRLRAASDQFYKWAASAGFVLVLATLAALIFVNIGFHETYERWRETEFGLSLGEAQFFLSIEAWVNDGLMAVFFLLVGIEIKREIIYGELSNISKAALPLIGAIGGMVVPIIVYLAFNAGLQTQGGWGIPMATDIAFTLGLMALLGSRVPLPLKVFVSALAIADDLGAILVIAVFYGTGIDYEPLVWAAGILAVMLCMNKARFYSRAPYLLLAVLLWYFTHESGLHATLAGVMTAALIPSRAPGNVGGVAAQTAAIFDAHKGREIGGEALHKLQKIIERLREPGYHVQHQLESSTNYLILPLFAFFNTGIILSGGAVALASPVSLGVIVGLVVGKPLGIVLFCWLAVKLRIALLPQGIRWSQMIGAGCLAGVGFTMSIFIATSAFEGDQLNAVKLSVLVGSIFAAVFGMLVLQKSSLRRV